MINLKFLNKEEVWIGILLRSIIDMIYFMKIARPYTKAIFNIAKKDNSYNLWKSFLFFFVKIIDQVEVKNFLKNPIISSSIKVKFLQSIYKDFFKDDLLDNFITFLVRTKKILLISFIYSHFIKNLFILLGKVQIKLEFSHLISKDSELDKNIVIFLNNIFYKKFCILEKKINKQLIGGIMVNDITNNKVIDMTFSGNLTCLKKKLLIL